VQAPRSHVGWRVAGRPRSHRGGLPAGPGLGAGGLDRKPRSRVPAVTWANVEPLVHDPAVQGALTDKITTEISHPSQADRAYTDQAAALLDSKGCQRVGALLQTFGPSISSAVSPGINVTARVQQDRDEPAVRSCLRSRPTPPAPPAAGQALSPGRAASAVRCISQRPGRAEPGPVHRPRQAGSGQARLHLVSKLPAINPTLSLFSAKYLVKAQTGVPAHNDLRSCCRSWPCSSWLSASTWPATTAVPSSGRAWAWPPSMLVLGAGLLIFRGST